MKAKQMALVQQDGEMKTDSGIAEKLIRRRFTAEYKLRVLCLAEMKAKIQLVISKDTDIECELVDDITPSPSGKYLYTIFKVDHGEGG